MLPNDNRLTLPLIPWAAFRNITRPLVILSCVCGALIAPKKKTRIRGQDSSRLVPVMGTIRDLFEAHSDYYQKANSRRIDFRPIDAAYNPCPVQS